MRILVVAGASGGHIFPALSFLESFQDKTEQIETLLVLPLRSQGIKLDNDINIAYISSCPIFFKLNQKNIIAVFKFIFSWFESLKILLNFRPDIVVGFGTLDSLPLIILAWLFRIKTLIHEQNVLPGKANKFLSRFADKIAISFKKTEHYLGVDKDKIAFTGNPLRRQFKILNKQEAANFLGLESFKFTFLILGGSQGSHKINQVFLESIASLGDLSKIQVIHICGDSDKDFLRQEYTDLKIKAKVFSFLKEIYYAYSLADLVICRAGASTVTELCFFKLPAVIIPYPYAFAHQVENARILEARGSSIIIQDENLNAANLKNVLRGLMNNSDRLIKMRSCFDEVNGNASRALRDLALSIL